MSEVATKKFELTGLEQSWVRVSLEVKRQMLVRSRAKEVAGSEIWALRGKEIEAIEMVMRKF